MSNSTESTSKNDLVLKPRGPRERLFHKIAANLNGPSIRDIWQRGPQAWNTILREIKDALWRSRHKDTDDNRHYQSYDNSAATKTYLSPEDEKSLALCFIMNSYEKFDKWFRATLTPIGFEQDGFGLLQTISLLQGKVAFYSGIPLDYLKAEVDFPTWLVKDANQTTLEATLTMCEALPPPEPLEKFVAVAGPTTLSRIVGGFNNGMFYRNDTRWKAALPIPDAKGSFGVTTEGQLHMFSPGEKPTGEVLENLVVQLGTSLFFDVDERTARLSDAELLKKMLIAAGEQGYLTASTTTETTFLVLDARGTVHVCTSVIDNRLLALTNHRLKDQKKEQSLLQTLTHILRSEGLTDGKKYAVDDFNHILGLLGVVKNMRSINCPLPFRVVTLEHNDVSLPRVVPLGRDHDGFNNQTYYNPSHGIPRLILFPGPVQPT